MSAPSFSSFLFPAKINNDLLPPAFPKHTMHPLTPSYRIPSSLKPNTAALTTAENTILSLQEQLSASTQDLNKKAELLSASENEIYKLSEQVRELTSKVETAGASGKVEVEQAQKEVMRLEKRVNSLEAAVAEGEWQVEKAEEEKKVLQKDLADMKEGKEAAEASLKGAKDVAAAAFDRVKYLEGQVKKAKSEALTARKTLEEELQTKDKEVVDTKAKLRHAIDNKYSFSALSADCSAWSKKVGAGMKFW